MTTSRVLEEHYYGVLGLDPSASLAECEERFRRKIREHHPDRFPFGDPRRVSAEEETKSLKLAMERIKGWKAQGPQLDQETKEEAKRNTKLDALKVEVIVKPK